MYLVQQFEATQRPTDNPVPDFKNSAFNKQIKTFFFLYSICLFLYCTAYPTTGTNLSKTIFFPKPYTKHSQRPPHTERCTQICKQTQAKPTRGGRQHTTGNVSAVHRGQCHSKWHEGKHEFKKNKVVPLDIHNIASPVRPADAHPQHARINQWKAAENLVCSSMGVSNAC